MGIFDKIVTAIRGGAREAGEAVVDANATRIFEQEIVDAENNLAKAKRDLTDVMAKEMQTGREVARLKKLIEEHEGYAVQALNKGDEGLAVEVANKIAELENELQTQQEAQNKFSQHASRVKEMIKKAERTVADLRRQLVMVKTTDSVHKATASITDNFANSNSRLTSAKDSLDRIRQRQLDQEDRMKAGEMLQAEMSGTDLQDKLRASGIGTQANAANDILARLKSKQG